MISGLQCTAICLVTMLLWGQQQQLSTSTAVAMYNGGGVSTCLVTCLINNVLWRNDACIFIVLCVTSHIGGLLAECQVFQKR